jgi:hypothetical protein
VIFHATVATFTRCEPVLLALSHWCAMGRGPPQ